MAIAGSGFLPYLTFHTAFFLQQAALGDLLHDVGIPRSILDLGLGDEFFVALLEWAGPDVLDIFGTPYENPVDEQGLQKLLN